jgi:outer membrane protein assembly factor BamB
MDGAVIELGPARLWEPDATPPSRRPPGLPAWLLPVVVTVATLLTVAAATAPTAADPVLSLREANTTLRFGADDTAYVITQRTRSGRLQAYPPGRTRPLWTVNFPGGYPVPVTVDDPGLLLLTVFDADPTGLGDDNTVQGRDAHTGRLLWGRPGTNLLGTGHGVVVVTDRNAAGGPVRALGADPAGVGDTATSPAGTVEAVDRRTGRPRWTRSVPSDALLGWDDATLVELAPDGRLRLGDPSTGETRSESRIALSGLPFHTYVDDGLVVVHQQATGGDPTNDSLSVAYDPASGTERWRRNTLLAGFCGGRYECAGGHGQLTVTDRGSGTVRYRGPADLHLMRGDRLVVSAAVDPYRPPGTHVYDLRTGRLAHRLPGWTIAGDDPRATLVTQELAGSGLMVADLDAATGRLAVLGRTTDWAGSATCVATTRFVGCSGVSGVRIWRPAR